MKNNFKKLMFAAIAALIMTLMTIGTVRTWRNHEILSRADEWTSQGYSVRIDLDSHTISRFGNEYRDEFSWELEDYTNPIVVSCYRSAR